MIKLSPETALPREKTRPITEDVTQIQFLAKRILMKKIERAKELTSHQNPEGKYDELFSKALDELLNKLDPRLREARRMYKHKKKIQKLKDPLLPGPVRSPGQRGEPEKNQPPL